VSFGRNRLLLPSVAATKAAAFLRESMRQGEAFYARTSLGKEARSCSAQENLRFKFEFASHLCK
jgi:hypothetical protein